MTSLARWVDAALSALREDARRDPGDRRRLAQLIARGEEIRKGLPAETTTDVNHRAFTLEEEMSVAGEST